MYFVVQVAVFYADVQSHKNKKHAFYEQNKTEHLH
jgi:hypothetical protein